MVEVEDQMAKLPHPFVNGAKMAQMKGRLVALVGKVLRIESSVFTISTTDERVVSVTRYEPRSEDQSQLVQPGNTVEVRGLVKGNAELQYGDLTRFEGEFDMGAYE